jgi:hypothetical protein
MASNQVLDTEAIDLRGDAAPLHLATGMLAEAWLDPLNVTASTWLDPLNLKLSAPRWSAVIRKEQLNSREHTSHARSAADRNGTLPEAHVQAGGTDCGAQGGKRSRLDPCCDSPKALTRTQNKTDLKKPVASRCSSLLRNWARLEGTHQRWVAALFLLALVTSACYVALPPGASASTGPRLLFGLGGTALALFCGLLPVRKRLLRMPPFANWRVVRSSVWEKGHNYIGLLSCLVLHYHAGFRMGGPLTSVLLVVLWAVIGSGLVELLFRYLLVLTKGGKEGKGLRAAKIIATGHYLAQQLHGPLTGTLFTMGAVHAVMALFY